VKVEDPNALRFILQDDIYLLNEDKPAYSAAVATTPLIKTQQVVFNYMGQNKRNFLVLVHYKQFEFMKDEHLQALESVLSRKGHSREDVAIVNLAKHDGTNFDQLTSFFEPKTLVVLGKKALPSGLKAPGFNQVEHIGIPVLLTFSFDEMMTNTDNKRAFWEQVKNI
jgi:hypothetical protein